MSAKGQVVMPKIYLLMTMLILVFLIYLSASILEPFFIAALIAYLINPLVNWLQRIKIPRILAVIIVFALMLSLITLLGLVLIPLIIDQIYLLVHRLPALFYWLQFTALPWINSKLSRPI